MQQSLALLPIQITNDNADIIEINVKRTDKKLNKVDQFKYQFYVHGGLKIDFSAGPFLSFLVDREYVTEDIPITYQGITGSDSIVVKKYIREQTPDHFDFMLGSLMHVHYRCPGYFNFAANFGGALNSKQDFVLLGGVSFILGRQQRFILNTEAAFGKVKRLSSPYEVNGEFIGSGNVPTIDRKIAGWAIGITYNLTPQKVSQKKE
ncbi:MAG: hypothetical protein IPQ03_09270 [Bacteroidetes bacterium]|nr:hypothetical protein [Bacteroidota bacterium]